MKKPLLSILLFSCLAGIAQAPATKWEKTAGGSDKDYGNAVHQTSDGGFVMAGSTTSTNGDITMAKGSGDAWITKFDSLGALIWSRTVGGSGIDLANAVVQTQDGGYIVAGETNSQDSGIVGRGLNDAWIIKLGAAGNVKWQKCLGGTGVDEAWDIQQTSDNGYIIAADARSNNYDVGSNYGISDFWIIKTDSIGSIQWSKVLGGSGTENAYSVQQTSDGGYIVAGQSNSTDHDVTGNNGGIDIWVTKLSGTGALQWEVSLGGTLQDIAYSVKQTSDGGYIVAGLTDSNNGQVTNNHGFENAWVVKLTSTGTVSWQKTYGGDQLEQANSVQQTSDGGYILGCSASSNTIDVSGNHGSYDFWAVKTSSTGAIQWQKCFGGSGSDMMIGGMQETTDHGYVLGGKSTSSDGDVTGGHGGSDFWIVRLMGTAITQTTTPTGLNELSAADDLFSVYPNPAHSSATIRLANSAGSDLHLQLLNPMGQLVYETEMKQEELQLNLADLPGAKGIYFLQVKNAKGTVMSTKKLLRD